jgi:uncharacterized membrane protein YhaH (DUF805 family)
MATTATAATRAQHVDHTALRVNQAAIILFLAIGFLLDQLWIVAFVAAVMALGTALPSLALFQRFYRDVLKPAGLLKPDTRSESPAPHRFAQGMGAAVLALATLALLSGAATIGWALALVVVVLAAVNLFFGFCAGCFIFFQLQRLRR